MKKPRRTWINLVIAFVIVVICMWFFISKAAAPGGIINKQLHKLTKSSPKQTSFNKNQYSLSNPTSIWVVVNKQRPLKPINYAPNDLVNVGGGQYMRKAAATSLSKMFADGLKQGLILTADSGYRSYQTQVGVYDNEVKQNGQTIADSESARPGYSEHQTGLAIDIGGNGCNITDCFAQTKAGQWVATNAYRYGFIIRYPQGKTAVTGYRYEPWHIRYIGVGLATEMHNRKIQTLEEFFGLPAAPTY